MNGSTCLTGKDKRIDGVSNGSCWSETSSLLTLAKVYPYLIGTNT